MLSRITAVLAFALAFALPAFAATPVNVNTADATTIAKSLDGVGQAKAEAIVAWRDAHGPFKSVEDLGQVKGIGQATLERNRDAIELADAGKADAAPGAPKHKSAAKAKKTPTEDAVK